MERTDKNCTICKHDGRRKRSKTKKRNVDSLEKVSAPSGVWLLHVHVHVLIVLCFLFIVLWRCFSNRVCLVVHTCAAMSRMSCTENPSQPSDFKPFIVVV